MSNIFTTLRFIPYCFIFSPHSLSHSLSFYKKTIIFRKLHLFVLVPCCCCGIMPKIICKEDCNACYDQGDSEIKFLHFGTFTLPIHPWNCKQRHSIYLVECNVCTKRRVYDGPSSQQVNTRIGIHYRVKEAKGGCKLDQHFIREHPNIDMQNNVTVFLISEPILDKYVREGQEQKIRRKIAIGEKEAGITETCLLNVNMTPMC